MPRHCYVPTNRCRTQPDETVRMRHEKISASFSYSLGIIAVGTWQSERVIVARSTWSWISKGVFVTFWHSLSVLSKHLCLVEGFFADVCWNRVVRRTCQTTLGSSQKSVFNSCTTFLFSFYLSWTGFGLPARIFRGLISLNWGDHEFNLGKCWKRRGGRVFVFADRVAALAAGSSVESDPRRQMDRYVTPASNELIS